MQGFAEKVAELGSDTVINYKEVVSTEAAADKHKVVEHKTTNAVSEAVDKSKKPATDAKNSCAKADE